ncbi:MAG: hypothetical protein U0441_07005 [Polyangiaceae bacterium]
MIADRKGLFDMHSTARKLALSLLLSGALLTPGALAQGSKAAAESLFQAAKQLMVDKKYAEACPKLVESQRLDPSPGTQLNLARCYEGLGKTASAWAEYKGAAVLAHQLGQKEREDGARDLANQLEPKLSKLTIQAAATPGLVVKSDGVEIGAASFGIAISVDPGEHVIEASAPGYETWTGKVVIGPNADSKTASVPALVKKPEAPATTATATATAAVTAAPTVNPTGAATSEPVPPQGSSTLRTVSYVLMGAGVVGLGVGAAMGGLAASDVSTARSDKTLCPDNLCTPKGRALVNDASTKALVSTITLPAGLVLAGAGVVLYFVGAPSAPKKGQTGTLRGVAVTPFVGPDGGAVSITGKF